MVCENELCIYQDNENCTLSNISINNMGLCDDCILINLQEDMLLREKEKILKRDRDDFDF